MKYNLSTLDIDDYSLLDELAERVNLDERVDKNCSFIAARNGNEKILGVAGINLTKKFPRFEHIIVDKKYQKTRLAVILMKAMERLLLFREKGTYVSYILNSRKHMQDYAVKWGMIMYNETPRGKWYYKNLSKESL